MTDEQLGQIYHTARNAETFRDFKAVALDILSASIADTAGAKARESLQLTYEQAIRLNAALESPSEPNEALKGAMEKFRAQESRERVSMTYEQFTELASKAKASNDLHMRVLALEASSYLKDEEISHLRKRIAATPAPSVADAAGAWQPIETAPKDGTKIILGKADLVSVGEWCHEEPYIKEHRDADGYYLGQAESDGFDGWMDWHGGLQDWTHWMPLPDAPAKKESGND